MEIKFPGLEKLVTAVFEFLSKDRRKVLPYPEVVIGTYSAHGLKVAILANVVLSETGHPPVDQFLERLRIGEPYCAKCSRPLDLLRASWMADGVQIGYNCPDCGIEIRKDKLAIRKEVFAEVRRAYDFYRSNYREAIMALTRGKPRKYRLP